MNDQDPGRSCPLHYHYGPAALAAAKPQSCEVLYVVGGLYGNLPALREVLAMFEQERGVKRLVFNGDFNWFNTDPSLFEQLNNAVLGFDALRGNVETELASADDAAGCGCAYPDWVGDGVVQRSNRILQRLRDTARLFPQITQQLAALPMFARFEVGAMRLALVHGDAQSLAGWGLAAEHLQEPAQRQVVRGWLDEAQVDAFACSHTCLPLYLELAADGRARPGLVLNNGATGMPNFCGDRAGLFTRVSLRPFEGAAGSRRMSLRWGEVYVDAIAVDSLSNAWRTQFLRQWPPGSDAHESYWQRISQGPAYTLAQALQTAVC